MNLRSEAGAPTSTRETPETAVLFPAVLLWTENSKEKNGIYYLSSCLYYNVGLFSS